MKLTVACSTCFIQRCLRESVRDPPELTITGRCCVQCFRGQERTRRKDWLDRTGRAEGSERA